MDEEFKSIQTPPLYLPPIGGDEKLFSSLLKSRIPYRRSGERYLGRG